MIRRARYRVLAAMLAVGVVLPVPAVAGDYRDRPASDEIIYFALPDRFDNGSTANDRGGLAGNRLATGFDPTAKGFYNGGDLQGLMRRLDYIAGLGATTIWLGPIFKNQPVQGPKGEESAGYHGYWITDFTRVDPHFGSNDDLKALVVAAHRRGMKVYLDIVTNHTADIIRYRECSAAPCPFRSRADFPYSRSVTGAAINPGFAGDHVQTPENFARLTRPDFAYTPYVPHGLEKAKVPAWLNHPIYYHNRGDSTFRGESSQFGDFSSLDDLATENPRVVQGFIDVFGRWIDEFGIDGFRIDTAQHVNPEFWQAFAPAMMARARARAIPNFAIFGEVSIDEMDPGRLARHTRADKLPGILDFAFWSAAVQAIGGAAPTSLLERLYADDPLYEGGWTTATTNPTFVSNHDKGRFGWFVRKANPGAGDAEIAARALLGEALMFFGRGVPTIYYGDEQGFAGDGGDQDARESLFASQVASYNDNRLIGTAATTATANFHVDHPFYVAIRAMAAVRRSDPRLRHGRTLVRASGDTPGLFAFSRVIDGEVGETLVSINTSAAPITAQVLVDPGSMTWRGLSGNCATSATAPGSYRVTLAPLSWSACTAAPSAN